LDQIARRFRREDLNVTLDSAPDLPAVAMAPEVLESVLSNLVDNARQHGGPNAHVRISTNLKKYGEKDFAEIVVQDDGPVYPRPMRT
jgi:signal transduction histidine kinase